MSSNAFSAADMTTAAASGHRDGYQAGYADAVKAFEAGKPAAAQEVVAYLDIGAGGYLDLGSNLPEVQLLALPKGRHALGIIGTYGIDGYAAAPVAAAPVDQLETMARQMFEAQADKLAAPWNRQWEPTKENWRKKAAAALKASTPAAPGIVPVHFVNLMDILRDEYAKVNWDTSAPLNSVRDSLISALNAYDDVRAVLTYTPSPMAAPGIDLEQFRLLANSWIVEAAGIAAEAKHACADELLALIDASPKGVINPEWSLHDRVEFALRDAGFDLDEAAFVAEAASVANGDLDSPKGGSTSDCPIIRLAPGEYTDWEKRVWRRGVIECATQPDIAAAMQATSAKVGS